eukprot:2919342-Alexandrium_andersonii.AAC.1
MPCRAAASATPWSISSSCVRAAACAASWAPSLQVVVRFMYEPYYAQVCAFCSGGATAAAEAPPGAGGSGASAPERT